MNANQIYAISFIGYGHWVETKAKSLHAAKALATRRFGMFENATLEVAIKHVGEEDYCQVAIKDGYRKWVTDPSCPKHA